MDIEGYGEFAGGSDDDDDIARFERQCAERARAEGELSEEGSDEEDEEVKKRPDRLDSLVNSSGISPTCS